MDKPRKLTTLIMAGDGERLFPPDTAKTRNLWRYIQIIDLPVQPHQLRYSQIYFSRNMAVFL
jgi:hypothetical protein